MLALSIRLVQVEALSDTFLYLVYVFRHLKTCNHAFFKVNAINLLYTSRFPCHFAVSIFAEFKILEKKINAF